MKIAYVGPFEFPSSTANALRIKGMTEALVMAGYEVDICSSISSGNIKNYEPSKGINIYSVNESSNGIFANIHAGLRGLFWGNNTLDWLQSLSVKPNVIVLYGTHLGYLLRLLPFCKKHNITLLLDVVEWYDPSHLPGGVLGPFALSNELSMRVFAKKADGLFVISRYLQTHFEALGCKVLRVPPMFGVCQERPTQFREANARLNLCYVGSPGKKEDFQSIFDGLQMAYESNCVFTMHVVGLSLKEFEANYMTESLSVLKADGFVRFYGRVDNVQAKQIVASCDFLLVLRKNERFVQAGFPSKVPESLCLGTPIMANLMSNIGDYVADNQNAIVVPTINSEGVKSAIMRACQLSESDLVFMKSNALNTASQYLQPKSMCLSLDEFVKNTV